MPFKAKCNITKNDKTDVTQRMKYVFLLLTSLHSLEAIHRTVAQLFLYAEQLVVLGHAVASAQGTRFDLSAVGDY